MTYDQLQIFEERIQNYLLGTMTETDRRAFEKNIQQNKELATEIQERQEIQFVIKNEKQIEIDQLVQEVITENPLPTDHNPGNPPSSGPSGFNWFWLLGTVLMVAIGLGLYQWNTAAPDIDVSQVLEEYLRPSENILQLEEGAIDPVNLGMQAYDAQQYEEAIPFLERYLANTPDETIQLYLAVSYLYTNQTNNAIRLLNSLQSLNDPVVSEEATWYLGLAYLQIEDWRKASNTLQQIKTNSTFYKEAQEVLQKL